MEQRDRDTIQRNIKLLTNLVSLDALYLELIRRGVIDQNFIERIKVKYKLPSEQAQEFFLSYTKRGPTAFQNLVEALETIGHISEANTLVRSKQTNGIHHSPQHSLGRNGHSPSSSVSPSTSCSGSNSLPNSPLMRQHSSGSAPTTGGRGGRVDPFCSGNMSTSSSSNSVSDQMRRLSLNSNSPSSSSSSFADLGELVINVKKAERYNNGCVDHSEAYPMQSNPRGFALIINNIEFIGDSEAKRDGAEKDTPHLQQLLEQLGYQVMIRHNVLKKDLIHRENGILKRFIDQFHSKNVDSCIVAIMSHGREGHFIRAHDAEDSRNWQCAYWNFYDDILRRFNNRYSPVLNGKPKIFIVQACLGSERDRGVRRRTQVDVKDLTPSEPPISSGDGDADWDSTPQEMPETEDMIACFATIPGFVSNRDIEHGTWYIRSLCKVFMENAHNTELCKLLKLVGLEMRKIRSEEWHKQMCSYHVLGFHKELYFNPGIFENFNAIPNLTQEEELNGQMDHQNDQDEDSPPSSACAITP